MDQRIEFALKALSAPNFRELCREYGISAKTGYKWRERFVERGLAGMAEESRRPHGHAEALDEAVVCEIVRLKQVHPHGVRGRFMRSICASTARTARPVRAVSSGCWSGQG